MQAPVFNFAKVTINPAVAWPSLQQCLRDLHDDYTPSDEIYYKASGWKRMQFTTWVGGSTLLPGQGKP
jgi:hypothetical protein